MGRSWKRHESGLAEGAAVAHGSVSPDGRLVLATADGGSLYGLERVANREYVFSSVFFGSGSAVPERSLWPHLDELAVLLRGDEDLTLFVEGHTDSDGSEETNQRLSERRAEWVCDYLRDKRVRSEQLVSTGYGELRPLFDEARPGGKARNRRVELVILSPHGELPLLEGME